MKQPNVLKALIVVAAISLSCAVAHAQSKRSPQHEKCMDSIDYGAMKNSQMATCSAEEVKRQDVTLNAEYRRLRESLSPAQRESLLTAQRSWLKFREDWCRFEEVAPTAPGGLANYYFCLLEVTDRQIEAFKSFR